MKPEEVHVQATKMLSHHFYSHRLYIVRQFSRVNPGAPSPQGYCQSLTVD